MRTRGDARGRRTAATAVAVALGLQVAALSTGGCSATDGSSAIVGALPTAKARDDQFAPYQEFTTATMKGGTIPHVTGLRLFGRRDRKTGETTTHARVEIFYEDHVKRYYDTARNARAEQLRLTVITRDFPLCSRRPCRYSEDLQIDIPPSELAAAVATGYQIKVFSRTGKDRLITIPRELVASLVSVMGLEAPAPAATVARKG